MVLLGGVGVGARICYDERRGELRGEHDEFGGEVELAACLGCSEFEALGEPSRFGSREGLIERGGIVGVEIELQQQDKRRVGRKSVGDLKEHVGRIDGGVAVGHCDASTAFQRSEHHEQIGDAIASYTESRRAGRLGLAGIGVRVSAISCFELSSSTRADAAERAVVDRLRAQLRCRRQRRRRPRAGSPIAARDAV